MFLLPAARRLLLMAPLGIAVAASACVDIQAGDLRYLQREEKRFTVSDHPDVSLATFNGAIEVRVWDHPEVQIVVERRGSDQHEAEAIRVESEQHGDRVSMTVKDERTNDLGFHRQRSASLLVTLPRNARVEARSGDGAIDIRDVGGELVTHTGDGSIRLDGVSGPVDARSGDGSILITGVLTSVHAMSGDGSVTVRASAGSTARDDWSINTGDGPVVLELPDNFAAELDARTGDGGISVRDLDLERTSEGDRSNRRVHGRLGAGGAHIGIHTGDGSITLRRF